MSLYDSKGFSKEFSKRTMANCKFINKYVNDKAVTQDKCEDSDRVELYEITQMLNSLMGIVVLPYEMHKEYFDDKDCNYFQKKQREKLRQDLIKTEEYQCFQDYVLKLNHDGKWVTTYGEDYKGKEYIKGSPFDDEIALHFLRHLRNVTCHSGNHSLRILPLNDGVFITDILFYDKSRDKRKEFAMKLSVSELSILIEKVALFYRDSKIGGQDKTKEIEKVKDKVESLLKEQASNSNE